MDINSCLNQDSREKFGVKSQMRGGGGGGGALGKREKRERICRKPDKVEVV